MKNHKIKNILDFLTAEFPENWVETYFPEDIGLEVKQEPEIIPQEFIHAALHTEQVRVIDKHSLLNLNVKKSLDFCFDSLYISVLSGEYISNNNFNIELQNLEKFMDVNFDAMVDDTVQAILDSEIKNNLVGSIKIALKLYKNFYKILETSFKYPNLDVISISNPTISKLINDNSIPKPIKEKLEFFILLVSVSRADHFLRDDISFYNDLIEIEHLVKNSSTPPATPSKFAVVLREKLQYLKYKWEIRQRTLYGKKNHIYMKSYLTDGELIIIDNNPTVRGIENSLSKWQNYLEPHYELGEWKSKIETWINDIDKVNLDNTSFLELHNLIKYYKDVSSNYDNLSEVVTEIEKRLKIAKFEVHTFNKIYSYALNNQFSLLLEQNDVSDDKIVTLKRKIDSFQSKTKIDNFFVEYKYIGFLLGKIEASYNSRKVLDSIDYTNDLITKVEGMLKQYTKNLSWADNHYHCVFQLPFEESLVDCGLSELPHIYYASSFVLPLSRIESQDNFEELVMKYNKLSTSIQVISSLTKEFSIIEETKDSLKDNDFKSIEVIGVFSAIITFIMASVPAIRFIDSLWKAMLFFISIASSLGLFLIVIFSIRKGIGKLKEKSIYIISFASILTIVVCSLFAIKSEKSAPEKPKQSIVQPILTLPLGSLKKDSKPH